MMNRSRQTSGPVPDIDKKDKQCHNERRTEEKQGTKKWQRSEGKKKRRKRACMVCFQEHRTIKKNCVNHVVLGEFFKFSENSPKEDNIKTSQILGTRYH